LSTGLLTKAIPIFRPGIYGKRLPIQHQSDMKTYSERWQLSAGYPDILIPFGFTFRLSNNQDQDQDQD